MKVLLFTIVLDGMPYITWHLPMLNRLRLDWKWHIMEGVAENKHCTSWCKKIEPRLSNDGTKEYLDSISGHKRVVVHRKELWDGKIEMVNAPMDHITEKTLVIQVDVDEVWTAGQIEMIHQLMSANPKKNSAMFTCRYFFGPNILVTGKGYYGNRNGEWMRAFVMQPGHRFAKHEPPVLQGVEMDPIQNSVTENHGLIFDHYAYAQRSQVAFKETYYGYNGAVEQWENLQRNTTWPVKLGRFLEWVKDDSEATVLS